MIIDYIDEVEIDDLECLGCQHPLYRQPCIIVGCDDGYIDMHEYDDPLLFDEGEGVQCQECRGQGFLRWC